MKISQKQIGILALLATVLLWGPGPVVTKLALQEIPQFSLAFLGRLLALSCMIVIFLPRGFFRIEKKDALQFFFAGLLGQGLNLGFFFYAIQHTSAITAQSIMTLVPIATALAAFFFLNERITSLQIGGAFLGLAGAFLIIWGETSEGWSNGSLLADIFLFFSMLSWVGYILISKRLSIRYSPVTITAYSILVGSALFLPFALFENIMGNAWISSVGFHGWFGLIYQGIFASLLAFLAYQAGLKLTSAFVAGMVLYLNPVATTLFAVPILNEKISMSFIVGTSLILAGSFIATQFETIKNHMRTRAQ